MKSITFLPKLILIILLATCILLLALSPPALAQEPDYDRVNAIAEQLNCPTCAGINLADCRTQTCAQWKDQISEFVTEGQSDQQILDYFATRFGEQVLQEPPKRGFTLSLWILPVIAFLVGGLWLIYTLRRWSSQQPAPVPIRLAGEGRAATSTNSHGPSDYYLEQVNKDLGTDEI